MILIFFYLSFSTSNVLAGKVFGIPVKGTHAHAFVSSYNSIDELVGQTLAVNPEVVEVRSSQCQSLDFLTSCKAWQQRLADDLKVLASESHSGELAAFASYAMAFPNAFTALIDTYDVCKSGILNFCSVAFALNDFGYRAVGIRIDSGDLAYLSILIKDVFDHLASCYSLPWFSDLQIVASNDINEETILSLNEQGHKITCLGIGTHLVTCQKQPALGNRSDIPATHNKLSLCLSPNRTIRTFSGCVFKLVEIDGKPRLKLSQDVEKVTMPGRKKAFRSEIVFDFLSVRECLPIE
jgi:nicotinate phosphoribosyltransferase